MTERNLEQVAQELTTVMLKLPTDLRPEVWVVVKKLGERIYEKNKSRGPRTWNRISEIPRGVSFVERLDQTDSYWNIDYQGNVWFYDRGHSPTISFLNSSPRLERDYPFYELLEPRQPRVWKKWEEIPVGAKFRISIHNEVSSVDSYLEKRQDGKIWIIDPVEGNQVSSNWENGGLNRVAPFTEIVDNNG